MRACPGVSIAVKDGSSLTAWDNRHSANLCTGQGYRDERGATSVRYQREYKYIYIHRERESFGGTNRTKETTGKT
jgi:hypothetical protein